MYTKTAAPKNGTGLVALNLKQGVSLFYFYSLSYNSEAAIHSRIITRRLLIVCTILNERNDKYNNKCQYRYTQSKTQCGQE